VTFAKPKFNLEFQLPLWPRAEIDEGAGSSGRWRRTSAGQLL
jgi:hypothetical protein